MYAKQHSFLEAEKKLEEIKGIIDLLHGHTFAVELAARLLANGMLDAHSWFTAGNFGTDCEFKENDTIDLLIHYCRNRHSNKGAPIFLSEKEDCSVRSPFTF